MTQNVLIMPKNAVYVGSLLGFDAHELVRIRQISSVQLFSAGLVHSLPLIATCCINMSD